MRWPRGNDVASFLYIHESAPLASHWKLVTFMVKRHQLINETSTCWIIEIIVPWPDCKFHRTNYDPQLVFPNFMKFFFLVEMRHKQTFGKIPYQKKNKHSEKLSKNCEICHCKNSSSGDNGLFPLACVITSTYLLRLIWKNPSTDDGNHCLPPSPPSTLHSWRPS